MNNQTSFQLPYATFSTLLANPVMRLGIALLLLMVAGTVHGAQIYVDGVACQLADAITAANTDTAQYGCASGSGADTLILTRGFNLQMGNLPQITSAITIQLGALQAQEDCGDKPVEDPPPTFPEDKPPNKNDDPTDTPTATPSDNNPTATPTATPSDNNPTATPTATPSDNNPTATPTATPSGNNPTATPTATPSGNNPTATPTATPSGNNPTATPTATPSDNNPTATPFGAVTLTPFSFLSPTPSASPTPDGTGTPTPSTPNAPDENVPDYCIHVVAWGQTLSGIAELYNMSAQQIAAFNNLLSADRLLVGQELIIPYESCLVYIPLKG